MKREHAPALIALVGASFVVHTALAWLRATPALFPDEYIYSSLGRSLAESGRPLIRGGSAHFPALLQPILTAPAWLIGDVGVAFRVVQTISALAMSLAAIPVYVLAIRLGLSRRVALALAALAVLVPDFMYASFVTSEPFAYPLVLATVAAASFALAQPTRRTQVAFIAFAALAVLTRAQLAVLPVVFFIGALVMGLQEHRVRSALREQLLPLGAFLIPVLGLTLAGPAHVLGYYRSVLHLQLHPIAFLRWAGWDAMVLAYASGWIIVPGAILGLWLMLRCPATRLERSFAVVTVLLALALLAEAGLLQANAAGQAAAYGANEIKERYVFYIVPLAGICFALYARRGWPMRVTHLALAAALLILSVRVPLSGFAIARTLDASPVLFAVFWLTEKLGGPGNAASVVAAAVGLLSVVAVLASRRPRLGTPLVLGLALLATGAASAGAVALDVQSTGTLRRSSLPADPSWVDHFHLGKVTLVEAYSGSRGISLQELFWNRSVKRVVLLPGATAFDSFHTDRADVGDDGSLTVAGRPLRRRAARRHLRLDRPAAGRAPAPGRPDRGPVDAGAIRTATPASLRRRAVLRRMARQHRGDLRLAGGPRPTGLRLAVDAAHRPARDRAGQAHVPVPTQRADVGPRAGRCIAAGADPGLRNSKRARDLPVERPRPLRVAARERAGDRPGVHAEQFRVRTRGNVVARRRRGRYGQTSPLRRAISSRSV